jgi:DNA-binding transcriptional LysR family regulator
MDIYLLKYFLAVVETGSFTRAADRAFVTQPTLSAGIKKLEQQMGHVLFERSNRRVFLTDAGTRFLPRARAVIHECNMARQVLDEAKQTPVLRVGILTTMSNREVGELFAGFKRVSPNVAFEIIDGTEQELENRLEDRSLDFSISITRGVPEDIAIPLRSESYVFILSNDHPLAGRVRVSATDLAEEYMIVRSRCEVLSETSRYFTDRNVRPRLVYRTPNDGRALAMVAAGLGSTLVPQSLVDERVSAVRLNGFDLERRLGLYLPRYDLPLDVKLIADDFINYVVAAWS